MLDELRNDPRWYCPFYKDLQRTARRYLICCEGGSRVSFEGFREFEDFAARYCRCADYTACAIARSRLARWGVDPDEH